MEDIMLDSSYDLLLDDGDLALGASDAQHQLLLLQTNKGEWKSNPRMGAGLEEWLLDDDVDGMMRSIREQFAMDGLKIKELRLNDGGKLTIDATY